MANKPYPVSQTIQSAGIEQGLKRREECDAEYRGDHLGAENAPFGAISPNSDWQREYHTRCEFERQYGEIQGKSTYTEGTMFIGRPRRMDPPLED
jgi:hypothetical protein